MSTRNQFNSAPSTVDDVEVKVDPNAQSKLAAELAEATHLIGEYSQFSERLRILCYRLNGTKAEEKTAELATEAPTSRIDELHWLIMQLNHISMEIRQHLNELEATI